MRKVILLSMLAGMAACGGNGTEPALQVINVRVIDDRGAPVVNMPVTVSLVSVIRDANTGRDGSVAIEVAAAGDYTIHVVPRAGYSRGVDPLTRRVSLAPNGRASVEFTVYRDGVSTGEPPGWTQPGN